MRVGIFYSMDLGGGPTGYPYAEIVQQVQAADEMGIDSAWFAEKHYVDGGCPSPQVLVSALGQVTSTIRLGPAAKILPLENPVRVAEDWAQIDMICDGRLNFCAWEGDDPEAYRAYSIPYEERWDRFQECMDFILRAWTNDAFCYVGRFHRFPANADAPTSGKVWERQPFRPPNIPQWHWGTQIPQHLAITPKPIQQPHPPVSVFGWREEAVRYAARKGYSFIFSPLESLTRLREKMKLYEDTLAESGRDLTEVESIVVRDIFVHEDAAEARRLVEDTLVNSFRAYHADGSLPEAEGRRFSNGDLTYDALAEDRFLVGTPDQVVNTIKELQRDTGLNHIVCRVPFPGVTHQQVLDFFSLLAREVQPSIQVGTL